MSRTARISLRVFLLLGAVAARLAADVHPNGQAGVAIDAALHVGDIDNINLWNGALTLTIPLGPSYPAGGALSYRLMVASISNPWDYSTRIDDATQVTYNDSTPNPAQDKLVSKGEERALKKAGFDFHGEKKGLGAGKGNIYKDRQGWLYIKPLSGEGPGHPLGFNINDILGTRR
ncbi:MAG: polymorphic toxin type 33 domain-containing protein [Acidobacteriota bacterium]|nr:polymorphic toxin type 33 domain-containing protein [Acidobacteriota bacterium]